MIKVVHCQSCNGTGSRNTIDDCELCNGVGTLRIIDKNTIAYILRGGESLELHSQPGTIVSAIPLERKTSGITYMGLRWFLENATLAFGTPRGVSNVMTGTKAKISLKEGILLIFLIDSTDT